MAGKKNLHGLNPRTFPQSVRWKVDQDYVHKLSAEEKAWLAQFNDEFAGADFRKDKSGEWPTEERRKAYRAKNAAGRDIMNTGLVDFEKPIPEQNTTSFVDYHVPSYLNSEEYKQVLREIREEIDNKKGKKAK